MPRPDTCGGRARRAGGGAVEHLCAVPGTSMRLACPSATRRRPFGLLFRPSFFLVLLYLSARSEESCLMEILPAQTAMSPPMKDHLTGKAGRGGHFRGRSASLSFAWQNNQTEIQAKNPH